MPDSKEQAQTAEQDAQNAKGTVVHPLPRNPGPSLTHLDSQTPTIPPIPSTQRYIYSTGNDHNSPRQICSEAKAND